MSENDLKINKKNKSTDPKFWDLLTEIDKKSYSNLKIALDELSGRRNRGHRIEAFDKILETIHNFAERNDCNDWKRFLVCGVCWMEDKIAINTRQLRLLISKCKSSINGSLQKLGYSTHQSHSESWKFLFERIPQLKEDFKELRQWTIRKKNTQQIFAFASTEGIDGIPTNIPIKMKVSVPNENNQHTMRFDLFFTPQNIETIKNLNNN